MGKRIAIGVICAALSIVGGITLGWLARYGWALVDGPCNSAAACATRDTVQTAGVIAGAVAYFGGTLGAAFSIVYACTRVRP